MYSYTGNGLNVLKCENLYLDVVIHLKTGRGQDVPVDIKFACVNGIKTRMFKLDYRVNTTLMFCEVMFFL